MKKKIFYFSILFIFFLLIFNKIYSNEKKEFIKINGKSYEIILQNNQINLQVDPNNYQNYDVYEYLKNFKVKLIYNNQTIEPVNYDYKIYPNEVFITNRYKTIKKYPIEVDFYELAYTKIFNLVINIDDFIKPSILLNKEIIQDIEQPKIEEATLKSYFNYFDNYYEKSTLKFDFLNYKQINSKQVGTYNIDVKVTDLSNNFIIKSFNYKVVDLTPPTIKQLKPLELYLSEEFNFKNFFEIKDNTDLNPVYKVDLKNVNFSKIGTYNFSINLKDKYQNSVDYNYSIKILDKGISTINLKKQVLEIKVNSKNYDSLINNNLLNIKDPFYKFSINDLTIDKSYINFNKLGTYKLTYYLYKDNLLRAKQQIDVRIIDIIKPTITKKIDLIVPYKSNFNIYTYFDFNDNYTDKDKLDIKYEPKTINTNVFGNINITVTVKDEALNVSKGVYVLKIQDTNPPVFNDFKNIYLLDVGKNIDYSAFNITDESQFSVSIDIKDNLFYNKLGTYKTNIIAKDIYNNTTIKELIIKVVDDIDPVLIIKPDTIKQEINLEEIDFSQYILEVSDNYDLLTKNDVVIKHNIDYTKVGKYQVSFYLKDKQNNLTILKKDVFIDDFTKPLVKEVEKLILTNDFSLEKLKEGLEIYDNSNDYFIDTNIEKFDTTKNSDITLIYYISDKKGNLTVFERKVTIINKQLISLKIIVLIVSLLYVLCIFIFYILFNYYKYKNFKFLKNIFHIFKQKNN